MAGAEETFSRSAALTNAAAAVGKNDIVSQIQRRVRKEALATHSTLLLRGLARDFDEAHVRALCGPFGPLDEVTISRDFATGELRGEAVVRFSSAEDAGAARLALDGASVARETITVEAALDSQRRTVAIVGGGTAGMVAALEAANAGAQVLVFERETDIGGNAPHTSGAINLLVPEGELVDSVKAFVKDMVKHGGPSVDKALATVLAANSPHAIEFLRTVGCDIEKEDSPVPGHSAARTYRTKVAVHTALRQRVADSVDIRVVKGASVTRLVTDDGRIIGIGYLLNSAAVGAIPIELRVDAVVVATGGFGASRELIRRHVPRLARFPTSSTSGASGDGHRLCEDAGALLVHMDRVTCHPTGVVDPKRPDAHFKARLPEALRHRGGAVLVDETGARFVNEVASRDLVADAVARSCEGNVVGGYPCAYLVVSADAVSERAVARYLERGLLQRVAGVDEAANVFNWNRAVARRTFARATAVAEGAGRDEYGRDPATLRPFAEGAAVYVALVTPVIHQTLGGVAFTSRGQVLQKDSMSPIAGLFVAGQVAGGVHGEATLPGNRLLQSVVFGRIAGAHAAVLRTDPSALSPSSFTPLRLQAKYPLCSTVTVFRFAFPTPYHQTGLSLGQFVALRAMVDGKEETRYYSPLSRPDDHGHIDLLIKTDVGKFTTHLNGLPLGSIVHVKTMTGPELAVGAVRNLGLLAGGTGLAAMIQIVRAHLTWQRKVGRGPGALCAISLCFGAKNEDELLLKNVLDDVDKDPNVNFYCTLAEPSETWKGPRGFIDKEVIRAQCPPPGPDTFIIVAGPPGFCHAMTKALRELGYNAGGVQGFYSYL